MPALRVAIDATPLLGARTGIGVAVAGFLRSLAGRPELTVTGYGLTARGWRLIGDQLPTGVGVFGRPAPAAALIRAWRRLDLPPGEWWTGPADVVHGTNFVVPPTAGTGRIVSVWDLTAVRYPELCTPTSRRYPGLVARAVTTGAWIHTGARSVADEVVEHFGIDPDRVRVVPPPVDLPLPVDPQPPPGPASSRGGSGRPYILALGRTEPRKDLPGLVRAFDRLAGRQPDLELRIAGPPGWAEQDVVAAVDAARHRSRIHRVGWVEDAGALLAGAAVFAYPSLYEGFGLPPLEAMAMGVPVVATDTGAVPEVVDGAAELVPPGDPDALAQALDRVLSDDGRRQELVRAGRTRAAAFSPERTAAGLVAAYRDVAAAR